MMPDEAIVLTTNAHINAAAIGVYSEGKIYRMRVFANSNTYANLSKNDYFSINFVGEERIGLLVRSALLGHNNEYQEIKNEEILFWHDVPYLKEAHTIIARVLSRESREIEDWVGKTSCLIVSAIEVEKIGEACGRISRQKFIPILECAVLASKYFDAKAEAKLKIRREVANILASISGFEAEVQLIKEIVELEGEGRGTESNSGP